MFQSLAESVLSPNDAPHTVSLVHHTTKLLESDVQPDLHIQIIECGLAADALVISNVPVEHLSSMFIALTSGKCYSNSELKYFELAQTILESCPKKYQLLKLISKLGVIANATLCDTESGVANG